MSLSHFFRNFNLLGDFPKDDLLYAMYPLYKICKFCGVCPLVLNFQNGRANGFKLTTGSIVQSGVILMLLTMGFIMAAVSLESIHSYFKYEHNVMSVISAWIQVYSLFIVAALGIITSCVKREQKVEVYHMLRNIDKRLISIGCTILYVKTRRTLITAMYFFSLMPLIFSMVNCGVINSDYNAFLLCYWFFCFSPMLVICLKEFQYYNLILLVKNKFDEINKRLAVLARPVLPVMPIEDVINTAKMGRFNRYVHTELRKIATIYSDLVNVVLKIQDIFALHLLLMITTSFMVLTIQTYNIFAVLMKNIEMSPFRIFAAIAWMLVQSFVIVMNIQICAKTSKAMSDTGPLLHNIQSIAESRLLFQTAQMFSLQIMHRNVNFTAAGFFNLDYKLITSIVAAVTTYLVIIIQFHFANTQNMNMISLGNKTNGTV